MIEALLSVQSQGNGELPTMLDLGITEDSQRK